MKTPVSLYRSYLKYHQPSLSSLCIVATLTHSFQTLDYNIREFDQPLDNIQGQAKNQFLSFILCSSCVKNSRFKHSCAFPSFQGFKKSSYLPSFSFSLHK